MEIQQVPFAKAEMLIRKPVAEVYEAFWDPAITAKFYIVRVEQRY